MACAVRRGTWRLPALAGCLTAVLGMVSGVEGQETQAGWIRRNFVSQPRQEQLVSRRGSLRWVGILGDRRLMHSHVVRCVAFSRDGKWIASGTLAGELKVWDAATGAEGGAWAATQHRIRAVAFGPDGSWIVTGGSDGTLSLWDSRSGALRRTFKGHSHWVLAVAVSPDGKVIASGSADHTVRLWDTETGQELREWRGLDNRVVLLRFSPDGKQLAWAGSEGMYAADRTSGVLVPGGGIRLWDVRSGVEVKRLLGLDAPVTALAFTEDGKRVASAIGLAVRIWSTAEWRVPANLEGHRFRVVSLGFDREAGTLRSVDQSDGLREWNYASGEARRILKGPRRGRTARETIVVPAVAISPDGQWVASACEEAALRVWSTRTGADRVKRFGHERQVTAVCVSRNGEFVASGSADSTLRVWNASTGRELRAMVAHDDWISALACGPDGKWLASGSRDRTVRIWDAATGAELRTLRGHGAAVTSVAVSPDGKWVVSGSLDGTGRIWDAATGDQLKALTGHEHGVRSVAVTPDGKLIITGDGGGTIRVWDSASGGEVRTIRGPSGEVCAVAVTPDGRHILAGCDDGSLDLWDTGTGARVATLARMGKGKCDVAFSADGRWIVTTSSGDRQLRVWEMASRRVVDRILVDGVPTCVAASESGMWVGCGDSTVCAYEHCGRD